MNINKVILIGRLVRDSEVRTFSASGTSVLKFSVAVNEVFTDKSGVKQTRTEFFDCSWFTKFAESISERAKKGVTVYVEGKIKTETFTTRDGLEKSKAGVIVDVCRVLARSADTTNVQQPDYDHFDDVPF